MEANDKGREGEIRVNLEKELNEAIKSIGLFGWLVVWSPDESLEETGRILPDDKIILIHDKTKEKAVNTLAHEVLEIQMRAMIRPYHVTVNALLKALEKVYYEEKEIVIKNLTPLLVKMIEETLKEKVTSP